MGTIPTASFAAATTRIGVPLCRLQISNLTFFPSKLSTSLSNALLKHLSPTMSANSLQVNGSSAIDVPSEKLEASSRGNIGANDLLIVGPGVLGRLVAEKWREEHPGCQIYGQTVTTDHHDELIKMGINPSSKQTKLTYKFPYVIFCAPPSQTEDYAGDIREAALNWNGEGSFLFTSSSAPYDCFDNGAINEDGPIVPIGRSPRTDVLLKAEKVVLDFDDRGAHIYWLHKGSCDIRPDHILNLIHYEDAASLSVTILKKRLRGRIFLGCDNHPVSRQEVMDLVEKSGKFDKKFEGFTGTSDPLGKKLNNSKTRAELGWEPKYPSFAQFLGVSE
ncbi:hypothetical protein HAX54_004352 [Datura stramonium]|uniref:NAD(P)-binding Rossmann-fold superfamily protein n=1 Tax=Datura stramonium TaxID=4076 RepID=A0ABS8RTQ1_DATST|nr:hypothetical protein [Datura stramonium]